MKQIDKTIKYFMEASISTNENKDNAVFNKILDAANTNKPSAIRLNRWRIIMHSKITKSAAAAIILIGAFILLTQGNGTSVAWADMIRTMKQQKWIYMYYDNGSNISQWWFCPEDKISIHNYNGNVTYKDFNSNISYFYDKERNEIEERFTVKRPHDVTFQDEQQIKEIFNRPYEELERLRRYISNCDGAPEVSLGRYRGHDVRVLKYKSQDRKLNIGDDGYWLTMYLDSERELLRGYVMWSHYYVGADPKTARYIGVERGERAFDYPNPGPQNIYDAGVPKKAKVIDRYNERFIELLPVYNQHKKTGLNRIACIITSNAQKSFHVFYVNDEKMRHDHRRNLMNKASHAQKLFNHWPNYRGGEDSNYKSPLAWLRDHVNQDFLSIEIDDGEYESRFSKSYGFMKYPSEKYKSSRYDLLGKLTWPHLDVRSEIFEDEYSRKYDLVGIKYTQKTMDHMNDDIFLYYLNPAKDYLCHKEVINWGSGSKQVHEIEEYQRSNGLWYPRVIRYSSQMPEDEELKCAEIKTLLIDEKYNFPENTFDVDYAKQLSKQRQ